MKKPLISVIIVTWNGRKWLKDCLDGLSKQTYGRYEIIFVDNASTDDSVRYVKTQYPEVKVVENGENLGFAGGNNTGLDHAKGDLILLLNNDTRVEPDYLVRFARAFDEIPNLGAVQSKLVLMDPAGKLDSCGSYWTDTGFLFHIGNGQDEDLPEFNKPFPVYTNKGASMMIRRKVIDKVGLFDDDFWCYYEETDLCHRIWLAGYECWYYPAAEALHAQGGSSKSFENAEIQFHNFKNKICSLLKNFEARRLVYLLPLFLFLNIAISFAWLIRGKYRHFWAIHRAIYWNLEHLSATLSKRRRVQALRIKSDKEIMSKTTFNPRPTYYFRLFMGLG